MPAFIDSHCHFDFAEFEEDRAALWQQCQIEGIEKLIIPGTEPKQWQQSLAICQQFSGLYYAAGIHPWWVDKVKDIDEDIRQQWHDQLASPHCVAIGECGLDKTIATDIDLQINYFKAHLALACELNLPLIIHVRKSHNETLTLLQHYQPNAGGVIHGFSGSIELAEQYRQLGFYLGIGGTITYPRANKTRNTVSKLPLESIVLETDAPDMPLAGFQGKRNTPLRIPTIAQALADLRNEPLTTIAQVTTQNSRQLFSL